MRSSASTLRGTGNLGVSLQPEGGYLAENVHSAIFALRCCNMNAEVPIDV